MWLCPWLTQHVFSERSASPPLTRTYPSRRTVGSVGSHSLAKGRDRMSWVD